MCLNLNVNLFSGMAVLFLVCVHTQWMGYCFICVNVTWDVWALRSCFQSDPFPKGIRQRVLVKKGERFHQNPAVKADVALSGKMRKSSAPPPVSWSSTCVKVSKC